MYDTAPVLVGVIGPPGAGKSTVVRELAHDRHLPVFRLREVVRARPDLLLGIPVITDPLGWIDNAAVLRLLHATFVVERLGPTVLLDNFPGTADQLTLLTQVAVTAGARVALLELHVDLDVAEARIERRRVCLSCDPDPHAPAVPADNDPERCRQCRGHLTCRDTDAPDKRTLRTARYRTHLRAIVHCAAGIGVRHEVVDAGANASDVRQAVWRVYTDLEGSRS